MSPGRAVRIRHSLVQCAVGTDVADYFEREVFRIDPAREFAREINSHRFGDSQPYLPGAHDDRHFGTAYPRRECPRRAMHGGVRIGADDGDAGFHESLFEKHLVAYPGIDVEKILQPELRDELAYHLVVVRMFLIGGGDAVVEYHHMPRGIVEPVHAERAEFFRYCRGVVVTEADIGLDGHYLPGDDIDPGFE